MPIYNNTAVTLYRFYSTNSGAENWGSDVMGSSTLPPGAAMTLNFDNTFGSASLTSALCSRMGRS